MGIKFRTNSMFFQCYYRNSRTHSDLHNNHLTVNLTNIKELYFYTTTKCGGVLRYPLVYQEWYSHLLSHKQDKSLKFISLISIKIAKS